MKMGLIDYQYAVPALKQTIHVGIVGMFMCVCIYVHMYVCSHTIRVCVHVFMHTCIYVCMHLSLTQA